MIVVHEFDAERMRGLNVRVWHTVTYAPTIDERLDERQAFAQLP